MSTPPFQSPHGGNSTKATKRRANSCVPCRISKSRCSGGIPCSSCQKKRQKPRCYYKSTFSKDSEDGELGKDTSEQDQAEESSATARQDSTFDDEPDGIYNKHTVPGPHDTFFGEFSLSRSVDEFKSLLPLEGRAKDIAELIQTVRVFKTPYEDESDEEEDDHDDEENLPTMELANVKQSISAVSLRSFVAKDIGRQLSKPLCNLYRRYLAARELLDSGYVAQAWTVLANLVREAELIGLDQDKALKDADPDNQESGYRRHVWWLLIDLDAQLSFLLGRRPFMSPSHRVPRPSTQSLQPEEVDLRQSSLDFSQYMLEVLSHVTSEKTESEPSAEVERRRLEPYLSRLQEIQSRLPPLQQDGMTDKTLWIAIAEHQFEVQLFRMVLHCQLARTTLLEQAQGHHEKHAASKGGRSNNPRKTGAKPYPRELLQCIRQVIDIFDYIYGLDSSKATSSWPRCLGLYCAAVALGIARLRPENDLETDYTRVERALKIFRELAAAPSPRPSIAQLAVASLGGILDEVKGLGNPPSSKANMEHAPEIHEASMNLLDDKPATAPPLKPADQAPPPKRDYQEDLKRPRPSRSDDEPRAKKRTRYGRMQTVVDTSMQANISSWEAGPGQSYSQPMSAYTDMSGASFHEPSTQGSFEQSFAASSATSFNANDQLQYANMGYASAHPDDAAGYQSFLDWLHPPMLVHPPMYWGGWQGQDISFGMMTADSTPNAFVNGPPMTMNEPARLQADIHDRQQVGLANMGPGPLPHGDSLPLNDARVAHARSNAQMSSEHLNGQQDPQFYNVNGKPFSHVDQAMSSPILGDGFQHQDGIFDRSEGLHRRRSIADLRQQQNQAWTMDRGANYSDHAAMSKHRGVAGRPDTPPRPGMRSPVSDSEFKTRRHSATPRQIAGNHPDMAALGQPAHGVMERENFGQQRKHSTAGVHDITMADIPPQSETMVDQSREQRGPPGWPKQPQHPQHPGVYDARAGMPYNVEMTDPSMGYDQHFHGGMPPSQIVTTGPFTGRQGWWAR